jgi:hypothetical protein
MRAEREGWVYPAYRISADRDLVEKYLVSQQAPSDLESVPLTYMIFLRGETRGVDLFTDLGIPRERALHGGQRYEWFAPVGWDDELEVVTTIRKITEKAGKSGTLWFADVDYDYRLADGRLALRETTQIIERG